MATHKLYFYTRFWDPNQLELLPVGPPAPEEIVNFYISGNSDDEEVTVESNLDRFLIDETDYGMPVPFHFEEGSLETDVKYARRLYAEYLSRGYRKTPLYA